MGERSSYENGTFNWVELGTDDPAGARDFYSALFGWEGEALPGGHGDYTVFRLGGKVVAAVLQRGEKQPMNAWNSYIAVDDADATAARASELGGTVAAGPFGLPGVARVAFILDPTGAAVGLWEARGHVGAELVNDRGAFCMNQLSSPDPAAAQAFFGSLFGWRVESMGTAEQPYWGLFRDDSMASMNASMVPLPAEAEEPPNWTVYFTVEDIGAAAAKASELGGSVDMEPVEIDDGRIAVLRDPSGAPFAMFEGDVDP